MISSFSDYEAYLEADKKANPRLNGNLLFSGIKNILSPDYLMQFLKVLRRTEFILNCKKGFLWKLVYYYNLSRFRKLSLKLGFSIPLNVFDAGLSLPHYGTIIVNPGSKIGKNCRLHACVNIGASGGSEMAPVIGNNVYIGPGAIIFGEIEIADNVTIAANATVYESILKQNVVIGGTPARILKENAEIWWIRNKFSLSAD